MFHRASFALTLCVLGLVFAVVGVCAAMGRVEFGPRLEYFPAAFRQPVFDCEPWGPGEAAAGKRPIVEDEDQWPAYLWQETHEPSLYLAAKSSRSTKVRDYRLTWGSAFGDAAIARVEVAPTGAVRLVAKRFSARQGDDPWRIEDRIDRMLTAREAARLERLLAETRVFDQPAVTCQAGSDGSAWILEANEDGAYRYVSRWSPQRGAVREVGQQVLGYTGWRLDGLR